jgi:hypothetical protein
MPLDKTKIDFLKPPTCDALTAAQKIADSFDKYMQDAMVADTKIIPNPGLKVALMAAIVPALTVPNPTIVPFATALGTGIAAYMTGAMFVGASGNTAFIMTPPVPPMLVGLIQGNMSKVADLNTALKNIQTDIDTYTKTTVYTLLIPLPVPTTVPTPVS